MHLRLRVFFLQMLDIRIYFLMNKLDQALDLALSGVQSAVDLRLQQQLQNSSLLTQSSLFLIHNSLFLIQSSLFLMQNSSFLLTADCCSSDWHTLTLRAISECTTALTRQLSALLSTAIFFHSAAARVSDSVISPRVASCKHSSF